MFGAQAKKAPRDMTPAEFDEYIDALAWSMFEVLGEPQGDINFDTESDPVDQLTDDEVYELYAALADEYIATAADVLPPDQRTPEEIRAEYGRNAAAYLASRRPGPRGQVAVREHGEIGPMLVRKGQHFTGPKEIP